MTGRISQAGNARLIGSLLALLVMAAACGADQPDFAAEGDLGSVEAEISEHQTESLGTQSDTGEPADETVVSGLLFLRNEQLFLLSPEPVMAPLLGVYGAAVEKLRDAYRRELDVYGGVEKGFAIGRVVEDGAAESAGLKIGEVITRFDGQKVEKLDDLRLAIQNAGIGWAVNVVVVSHDGSVRKVRVEIGSIEDYEEHRLMIWPPSGRRAVAWSPNTDRLLFVRGIGKPQLLYVINADGSDLKQVTLGGRVRYPTWSKDGKEIYFIGEDDDLYVINADGSNRRRLSGQSPDQFEGVNTQSWSPDRSQIAVVYNGLWESIYLMDADGSNERLLVGFEDHSIDFLLDVAWSADGNSLLFWGHQRGGPHSKGSVIFRVDSNGSNLRQLTTRQDDDHFDIAAKWSPDGSKISFLSNRDQGCSAEVMAEYSHCDQYESYLMNADGSETARVDGDIRGDLHWSPNGQQFAFNVPDGDECCLIYVADRDGTNQRSLGKRGTIMGWLNDRVLTP